MGLGSHESADPGDQRRPSPAGPLFLQDPRNLPILRWPSHGHTRGLARGQGDPAGPRPPVVRADRGVTLPWERRLMLARRPDLLRAVWSQALAVIHTWYRYQAASAAGRAALGPQPAWMTWAALLWRVFQKDRVSCPRRGKPMKARTVLLHSGSAPGHLPRGQGPGEGSRQVAAGCTGRERARPARRRGMAYGSPRPTSKAQGFRRPSGRASCASSLPTPDPISSAPFSQLSTRALTVKQLGGQTGCTGGAPFVLPVH